MSNPDRPSVDGGVLTRARAIIAAGMTGDVFKVLRPLVEGTPHETPLTLLENQFRDAQKRLLTGTTAGDDARAETNRVTEALLALIGAIEADPGRGGTRETTAARVAPRKLRHAAADKLFGRGADLARLDAYWSKPTNRVVVVHAWGGVGKTSLVAGWMARMAQDGWRGARRVMDWTFFQPGPGSGGDAESPGASSSDAFMAEALRFFDKDDPLTGDPWVKGARLARLVAAERTLLVLDGLEPLQYPPGHRGGLSGQLKDPAVATLLKGLASLPHEGLCVVTTREKVADLNDYYGQTAEAWPLDYLSDDAGADLLRHLGVRGPRTELREASAEVKGHAFTVRLLGTWLAQATPDADVRRRKEVRFDEADNETQNGLAFKAIAAYDRWLSDGGDAGRRQLAVLRMLGLFDRPADPGCLAALRRAPIAGLTDAFDGQPESQWNWAVTRLEGLRLLTRVPFAARPVLGYDEETARKAVAQFMRGMPAPVPFPPPAGPSGGALEAHPLVRDYFARRFRESEPDAWREAHRRLYEALKGRVPYWPEGLAGLEPLYQAVAHGCRAGLHEEARAEVYERRILRATIPEGFYSTNKLGVYGSDLDALASFFDEPWVRPAESFTEGKRGWLLGMAAYALRALGRLAEALGPMRAALEMAVAREDWKEAGTGGGNLSELELTLGDITAARTDGELAVGYSDRCSDPEKNYRINRSVLADALHQAGQVAGGHGAEDLFREAERRQAERDPDYPLLYSMQGFRYCDLLLAPAERAAWAKTLDPATPRPGPLLPGVVAVRDRARVTRSWMPQFSAPVLTLAVEDLTLGRAAFYLSLLSSGPDDQADAGAARAEARGCVEAAVKRLRDAGTMHHVPRGLLTRAWLRHADGDAPGAKADLDDAWEIAERGPMPLHMADIHLTRARLFRDKEALAKARALIDDHGYHRRDEELRDAEAALGVA